MVLCLGNCSKYLVYIITFNSKNISYDIVPLLHLFYNEGTLSSLLVVSFSTREKNNRIREETLIFGLENISVNKRYRGEKGFSIDKGGLPYNRLKVALYYHCC